VMRYADGVLFVSENPSAALHKVSEIYDRIAFAAVGRYNEFENLRIAGVRLADMRGYAYDRRDVTGRGLANAYAQTLGTIFSSGGEKPYEVELFVGEIGDTAADDQIYRLTYDGQVADEHGFAAMGGSADDVTTWFRDHWREDMSLDDALRLAVTALGQGSGTNDRRIPARELEAAVLDRSRVQQRKFRRLTAQALLDLLGPDPEPAATPVDQQGEPSVEPPVPDDPADPTDMSSTVPAAEDPVTGEPPPVGPPTQPAATEPTPDPLAPPPVDPGPPTEAFPPIGPDDDAPVAPPLPPRPDRPPPPVDPDDPVS
ncbi:MAG: prcA, partial [Nocardioidaceae bacterium]|nr:prcA [Nocardioidaceae bacterium]